MPRRLFIIRVPDNRGLAHPRPAFYHPPHANTSRLPDDPNPAARCKRMRFLVRPARAGGPHIGSIQNRPGEVPHVLSRKRAPSKRRNPRHLDCVSIHRPGQSAGRNPHLHGARRIRAGTLRQMAGPSRKPAAQRYSAATLCPTMSVEYRRWTGAFASHGSFSPKLSPYSLIAGITSPHSN
jgi:hypothetical protein